MSAARSPSLWGPLPRWARLQGESGGQSEDWQACKWPLPNARGLEHRGKDRTGKGKVQGSLTPGNARILEKKTRISRFIMRSYWGFPADFDNSEIRIFKAENS